MLYNIIKVDFTMEISRITVTTASGVEAVTKREIERLGYTPSGAINGAISFEGDAIAVARSNMFLRTADRVYISLKDGVVKSFDELFAFVKNYRWEEIFSKNAKIIVDGKCVKSTLFAISACQSVIKKAIVERLKDKYKINTLSETGETYFVDFYIFKDNISLRLNTSGEGLHKRGYRKIVGQAPIKETLASAMLLLSNSYHDKPFVDPFCGSGTFVIEGARLALNIASGKNRHFAYEKWGWFDKTAYARALEEAIDGEKFSRQLDFIGYDIDPKAIETSLYHAKMAGVDKKVSFAVQGIKDFATDKSGGVIVTNPPYGERLLELKEAQKLYKILGEKYRLLDGWSAFVITSDNSFEKFFGKRADRNRKLYNSNKECKYYQYYGKKVVKKET